MNFGYNLAAAGVMTAMFRQDVAANNLANIETTGFKADVAFTIPRDPARVEDHLNLPSNKLLERLGAGVLLGPVRTSFAQGALAATGNPLDLGIRGEGFFTVSVASNGNRDGDNVRLTRDGRLTLNSEGQLVQASTGHRVLDTDGQPISLNPGAQVIIDGTGAIKQEGTAVAQIRLVDVNKHQLRKVGDNLFQATGPALKSLTPASGEVVQRHLEQSSVDPIRAMMAVQDAASAVSSAGRLMTVHDELMGRLISSLGRVNA